LKYIIDVPDLACSTHIRSIVVYAKSKHFVDFSVVATNWQPWPTAPRSAKETFIDQEIGV